MPVRFNVYCTVRGVPDIATKAVDTDQMYGTAILFCERWINTGGGEKGDPFTGKPVQMTVVDKDASAILLAFEIKDEMAALMFAISGKDEDADRAIIQRFSQECSGSNWEPVHDPMRVEAPAVYLICDSPQEDVSWNVLKGLEEITDNLAAAFFNQTGLPV